MNITLWVSFALLVVFFLFIDLFVLHKKDQEISIRRALIETFCWILVALLFNILIYVWKGGDKAVEYLTAYIIEKSLSVDNLFVFIVIFSYYHVPKKLQHRVLFWGIIGSVVMRGIFIFFGIKLIESFDFLLYFLGLFLLFAGLKMIFGRESKIDPKHNVAINFLRRFIPIFKNYHGNQFFIRKNWKIYATPLFVVLIVVETTDIIFAMDSVPAILGITRDPLIVYTSNIFAILGLRALYFALAGIMSLFHLLRYGLGIILSFIGVKIFCEDFFEINVFWSLGIVLSILAGSVILSMIYKPKPATVVEQPINVISKKQDKMSA